MNNAIGQLYQCAKCFATFAAVEDVTRHLTQCLMAENNVYHQQNVQYRQQHFQQPQQQQQAQAPVVQPAPQIQQQQQQQVTYSNAAPLRQNNGLYGCARCGSRFPMVRELVLHLHVCITDTFHDRDLYLTPNLWVQAPEGQHIVINETETNTTLNTAGLWLANNDGQPSTNIVEKGFWVMPPPSTQEISLTSAQAAASNSYVEQPIKVESPPAEPEHIIMQEDVQEYVVESSPVIRRVQTNNWQDSAATVTPVRIQRNSVVTPVIDDSNKRKRGRAKVPASMPVITKAAKKPANATVIQQYAVPSGYAESNMFGGLTNEIDVVAYETPPRAKPVPINNGQAKRKSFVQQQRAQSPAPTYTQLYAVSPSTAQQVSNVNEYITSTYDEVYSDSPPPLVPSNPRVIVKKAYEDQTFEYSPDDQEDTKQNVLQQQINQHLALQEMYEKQNQEQQRAIVAEADDEAFDDLSHLDAPVVCPAPKLVRAKPPSADYIESYCSFLKNRTIK